MRTAVRVCLTLAATGLPLLTDAAGTLNASFAGRPPPLPANSTVEVVAGVDPGKPVVFDTAAAGKVVLRPARENELPTAERPLYRFEWQADGGQRFYEIADPAYVAKLDADAIKSVATDLGKTTNRSIVDSFAKSGALQKCVPPAAKGSKAPLVFFVVVKADGSESGSLFMPEGSLTECLQKTWTARKHMPPGVDSTFRWIITLK
jgi:hypothetical protein